MKTILNVHITLLIPNHKSKIFSKLPTEKYNYYSTMLKEIIHFLYLKIYTHSHLEVLDKERYNLKMLERKEMSNGARSFW